MGFKAYTTGLDEAYRRDQSALDEAYRRDQLAQNQSQFDATLALDRDKYDFQVRQYEDEQAKKKGSGSGSGKKSSGTTGSATPLIVSPGPEGAIYVNGQHVGDKIAYTNQDAFGNAWLRAGSGRSPFADAVLPGQEGSLGGSTIYGQTGGTGFGTSGKDQDAILAEILSEGKEKDKVKGTKK